MKKNILVKSFSANQKSRVILSVYEALRSKNNIKTRNVNTFLLVLAIEKERKVYLIEHTFKSPPGGGNNIINKNNIVCLHISIHLSLTFIPLFEIYVHIYLKKVRTQNGI